MPCMLTQSTPLRCAQNDKKGALLRFFDFAFGFAQNDKKGALRSE